jgi:hypothetical protein
MKDISLVLNYLNDKNLNTIEDIRSWVAVKSQLVSMSNAFLISNSSLVKECADRVPRYEMFVTSIPRILERELELKKQMARNKKK